MPEEDQLQPPAIRQTRPHYYQGTGLELHFFTGARIARFDRANAGIFPVR